MAVGSARCGVVGEIEVEGVRSIAFRRSSRSSVTTVASRKGGLAEAGILSVTLRKVADKDRGWNTRVGHG
jgi:hypothetical protein